MFFWPLLGSMYFLSRSSVKSKRQFHPWFYIGFYCYAIATVAYTIDVGAALLAAISWPFILYAGYRSSDFCEACGATLLRRFWPWQKHICPECGSDLSDAGKR